MNPITPRQTGYMRRNERLTDLERRNELRQRNQKEVEVEEELELLVEDDRQERERVILLVSDDVGRELLLKLLWNSGEVIVTRIEVTSVPVGLNGMVRDLSLAAFLLLDCEDN